ncbi:hypothetical protein [Winogradskyella costae]|uniref:hypothetical protein n=1 Tax=Winogradskyella costae TaxID=2697008 RepID=UPI001FEB77AF|nr:hypothetical protein [Winogradskyella costae]
MRNELIDELLTSLSDEFLNKVANLNVAKFKTMLHKHMEENKDHTPNIWKLFVLRK